MTHALAANVVALQPVAAGRAQRLTLLGTGTVGRAFVARYQRLRDRLELPPLATIANSRHTGACDGSDDPVQVLECVAAAPYGAFSLAPDPQGFRRGDIIVDATASDAVAHGHGDWLRRGVHVVTANKLGSGACLARANDIVAAQGEGGARYGDAATVGAGLPLLRSIRVLAGGGDRILAIEGVLSGSLAWLFHRYDGMRPFSGFVRAARAADYTEPDPRIDLSGEDVRRKLLILARAAGFTLDAADVRVDSLVPALLAEAPLAQVDGLLPALDGPLRTQYQRAYRENACLRFVGRLQARADGSVAADVGLRALATDHPLCGGSGTDNRVAIRCDRYDAQPLVIQGPGAGAEVTAAALLDDVLRISRQSRSTARVP